MADIGDQVRGKAFDTKAGAVVLTADNHIIYIAGLDHWPSDVVGEEVLVRGRRSNEKWIPDPAVAPDGTVSQGATGQQTVMHDPVWQRLH